MPTSRVDQKYRIVIDKKIRAKTRIKAGDQVIIAPIDDHSFKVRVLDFSVLDFTGNVEDDPGWKAFHPPIKIKKHLSPEKLEKIIQESWLE